MVGHGCLSTRVGVQPTLAEGYPVGWRGVEPPTLLPTSRYPVPPRWGTGQEGVFRFLRLAFSTRLCLAAAAASAPIIHVERKVLHAASVRYAMFVFTFTFTPSMRTFTLASYMYVYMRLWLQFYSSYMSIVIRMFHYGSKRATERVCAKECTGGRR